MSAIRIKNNVNPASRTLPPVRPGASLSNQLPRKSKGSPLPILLLLAVVGVGGYFGWKAFDGRMKAKRAKDAEYARRIAEIDRHEAEEAERFRLEAEKKRQQVKKVEEAPPEEKVERPREKDESELLLEEENERKEVLAKIAEARKASPAKPLNGFAGVTFGEPLEKIGAPVKWGTVLDSSAGGSVDKRGTAFAVQGPALKKPFMSLGSVPLVWVTPKTHKPYRVEFGRALALKPGVMHDPETTNLVAFLSKRFKSEPFKPLAAKPERKGCEFVFPMGDSTTMSVVEHGGELTFAVEREDLKSEAMAEAEALRKEEMQVAEADGKALSSTRYPHGQLDRRRYAGVRLKDETPRSFCGVVFACPPPEGATILVPQKGAKGFFLDYVRGKCTPFRGFVRGRADIDENRGGVYAVSLSSDGGEGGLDDKDYYESVRNALSEHFKVKPTEKPGEGEFPQLVYRVGELVISFGPDNRGGFFMRAENEVLAKLAAEAPAAASGPAKRVRR